MTAKAARDIFMPSSPAILAKMQGGLFVKIA